MDRDGLIGALPDGRTFNARQPYERKTIAEDFIASVLAAIADEGREPDGWEAYDIAAAIGYVVTGWYTAALVAAEHALTPPEARAPIREQPEELRNYAANPPSVRQLREALDYVRGKPARAH